MPRIRVLVVLTVLVLLVGLPVAGWWATGGRWFDVATPSMGRAAPVGSLLLTRPSSVARVRVGQVITFRGPSGQVYSHRVADRTGDGLRTRGDINPAVDAWTITDEDLIGRVVVAVPAGGWVLRALPWVLLVTGAGWGLGALLRPERRSLPRLLGPPLGVALATVLLHPWVGLVQLGTYTHPAGTAVRAVSTGLMPVHVGPRHATHRIRLVDGEVGQVVVSRPGRVRIDATPDLDLLWWVVVVGLCLAPLGLALAVGAVAREEAA